VEDGTKKGTANVTVVPATIELLDPPHVLFVNEATTFKARIVGLDSTTVNWTATGGTIDQTGRFSAPEAGAVTITAASVAAPDLKASVNVSVRTGPDGCTSTHPQLLGIAGAFGRPAQGPDAQYDLNGDRKIDDEDLKILFRGMGWM
jgi:hypothetical protein